MARRERRWYRRHSSGKLREIREYSRAFIAVFEATNVFLPAVILRESGKLYSHAHAANTEGSYLERCRGREREYVYVCERVGEKKDLLFLTWLLSATVLRSLHCLDVANRNAPWVYISCRFLALILCFCQPRLSSLRISQEFTFRVLSDFATEIPYTHFNFAVHLHFFFFNCTNCVRTHGPAIARILRWVL